MDTASQNRLQKNGSRLFARITFTGQNGIGFQIAAIAFFLQSSDKQNKLYGLLRLFPLACIASNRGKVPKTGRSRYNLSMDNKRPATSESVPRAVEYLIRLAIRWTFYTAAVLLIVFSIAGGSVAIHPLILWACVTVGIGCAILGVLCKPRRI
jgi:hypothetical protein